MIVCQNTFAGNIPNMDAYTWSECEWLMVEVNTLWRRARAEVGDVDKRTKLPFFCQYWNHDMVDNGHLGWHRQTDQCPEYDKAKYENLKIYPSMGSGGNKAARAVFMKYMMKVLNQIL